MKAKYLSDEDKRRLRALRQTKNLDEIAQVLEDALKKYCTLHSLWEYKKWFYLLTHEQLQKYPVLVRGLIHIYILDGELSKAKEILEFMPPDSEMLLLSKLTFPWLDKDERRQVFNSVLEGGFAPEPNMLLTAGRPSLLNGVWDFTTCIEAIQNDKENSIEHIRHIYGEQAENIYKVAHAESLYYQDECYEALVMVVGLIPFLKEKNQIRLLFVALTLEIYIMVQNGQTPSTVPMMDNLRKQIKDVGMEEYLPNINALDAWAAMYDGDYKRIATWMKDEAPDEYSKFCMLDLFGYMIKMRVYIIQGKHLAVTSLASKLLPLLKAGGRYMDMCELHMIWAMSDFADKRKEEAFKHLEQSLELSEKNHYDRLLADEGKRMCDMLKEYEKCHKKSAYLSRIIELSEKSAALFPRYLKKQLPVKPALTESELRILRLLQDNYTNAELGEELGIALETAKKHCKNIIAKMEVKNRQQAVQKAVEYGIIEEKKKGVLYYEAKV